MRTFLTLALIFISTGLLSAEEGMIPLSELSKLNLKAKGFELSAEDIFNPQTASLSDAIVKLGGCTGSFVSPEGLILTNHHCAFGAVQRASTPEHDYLNDGFLAKDRGHEIEAKGYTVRITQSFKDVSKEVLKDIEKITDFAERSKTIKKRRKEIVAQAERENPGMRAEVAEMFTGQTYVLFMFTYLKDVRMVYVPPIAIGNFGGEVDNWEWPRHTSDFSIMRAYVAADGSPADYSEDNVPYIPKKYVQVNPNGVDEEDLVFMLGYPGRTYRHKTSHYIDFQERVRMPFVVDWYQWQISLMEKLGAESREIALKYSSPIKSLANTEKNYRGKLLGLNRLNMVTKKREQETKIIEFLKADKAKNDAYSEVLPQVEQLYSEIEASAQRDLILTYLTKSVNALRFANTIYKAAEEGEKEDLERESSYMDRNIKRTKKYLMMGQKNFQIPGDKLILMELLRKASALPENQRIANLDKIFGLDKEEAHWQKIIDQAYTQSQVFDKEFLESNFSASFSDIKKVNDPILDWIKALQPEIKAAKDVSEERNGRISKLSAQWSEVKRMYEKSDFVPDANGTFRLTFGHIRGYEPADAVYKYPITTVKGIAEKHTGMAPFNAPDKLLHLIKNKDFGFLANKKLNCLPVGILYDCDTTGGNSGSPVFNAKGELIGLNFDRAFEATINDFAWAQSYSRSIGVDIRYVLWVIQKFAGADYLLQEMGIQIN